ncbi:hypothetical protein DL98DRAFT_512784 [Cadophora sp. DSE1049]|nr:hypothetical protein DL98DRAFT_512784 [Cadophora sp. DSE1049]
MRLTKFLSRSLIQLQALRQTSVLASSFPSIHQKPHGRPHTSGSTPLFHHQRLIHSSLTPRLELSDPANSRNRNTITIITAIIAIRIMIKSSHLRKWHVIPRAQTRFPAKSLIASLFSYHSLPITTL